MAGPRITKLGDPANPYSGKRTPTAAPTAAQQATNKAASQRVATRQANAALQPKPKAATTPVQPVMKRAQKEYADNFDKRIEHGVQRAMGKRVKP